MAKGMALIYASIEFSFFSFLFFAPFSVAKLANHSCAHDCSTRFYSLTARFFATLLIFVSCVVIVQRLHNVALFRAFVSNSLQLIGEYRVTAGLFRWKVFVWKQQLVGRDKRLILMEFLYRLSIKAATIDRSRKKEYYAPAAITVREYGNGGSLSASCETKTPLVC